MKIALACSKVWRPGMQKSLQRRLNAEVALIQNSADLTLEFLKKYQPDYVFFPHWSHLIPEEIFSAYTCVIFHMTDLPYGRGGSPLQNLILRGHKHTKMTAFKCDEGLDTGPVYLKRDLRLEGTAMQIFSKATELIEEMIVEIVTSKPIPVPQAGEPVIFQRRSPADSEIPKGLTPEQIYDFVRMLDAEGYPPAFAKRGDLRIEFTEARLEGGQFFATVRNLKIRQASLQDADFLLQIRNLPSNRQFFHNTGPVQWEEHFAWFEKTLRDTHSRIFIGIIDNKPIGQFRVDASGEVSVSLIENAKGIGVGAALIQMASAASIGVYNGLTAFVKTDNLLSQKSFLRAGYVYDCDLQRDGEQYKKYLFYKDAP